MTDEVTRGAEGGVQLAVSSETGGVGCRPEIPNPMGFSCRLCFFGEGGLIVEGEA